MRTVGKKMLSVILSLLFLTGIVGVGLSENGMLSITAEAASNPYSYNATYNGEWANCTWWAWQLAYDNTGVALPAWGNAKSWYSSAQTAGFQCDNNPAPNSIACYFRGDLGHVQFVSAVSGNQIYVKEGGYSGTSNGYHEGWRSTSGVDGYIHLVQSHNPVGAFDSCTGNVGSVTVKGWVLDEDDLTKSLEIHVYIGGSSIDGEGHGGIIANISRKDVDSAYHCGEFHGFSVTIPTNKTGYQPVYVYGINIGSGENKQIGDPKMVTITPDTEPPIISDAEVKSIDDEGFTVSCKVTDNVKVEWVKFPTWTAENGQDDIKWYKANISGDTATFRVLKSDHNNESGLYITDIYASDYSGNESKGNTLRVDYRVFTLVYNSNGGKNPPATQTGNGSITISSTKPTRNGYTFKKWNTKADGTGTSYNPGATYNLTANATLYAVWEKNETPDNPTPDKSDFSDFRIKNYNSTMSVDYKSMVVFHTTMEAPEGYEIVWSNGTKGSECKLSSVTNKEYKISAKMVNKTTGETEAVTEDVTVTVNTSFFAKLIAFFRNLFGLLPTYEDFKKK